MKKFKILVHSPARVRLYFRWFFEKVFYKNQRLENLFCHRNYQSRKNQLWRHQASKLNAMALTVAVTDVIIEWQSLTVLSNSMLSCFFLCCFHFGAQNHVTMSNRYWIVYWIECMHQMVVFIACIFFFLSSTSIQSFLYIF